MDDGTTFLGALNRVNHGIKFSIGEANADVVPDFHGAFFGGRFHRRMGNVMLHGRCVFGFGFAVDVQTKTQPLELFKHYFEKSCDLTLVLPFAV